MSKSLPAVLDLKRGLERVEVPGVQNAVNQILEHFNDEQINWMLTGGTHRSLVHGAVDIVATTPNRTAAPGDGTPVYIQQRAGCPNDMTDREPVEWHQVDDGRDTNDVPFEPGDTIPFTHQSPLSENIELNGEMVFEADGNVAFKSIQFDGVWYHQAQITMNVDDREIVDMRLGPLEYAEDLMATVLPMILAEQIDEANAEAKSS